jgi:hypothetical protein
LGRELHEPAFLESMVEEGRVIYNFGIHRSSGLY